MKKLHDFFLFMRLENFVYLFLYLLSYLIASFLCSDFLNIYVVILVICIMLLFTSVVTIFNYFYGFICVVTYFACDVSL